MKKQILTIGALVAAAAGVNAQGLVAGWDFSDVSNLAQATDGYAAEKTAINNGIVTSGTLYTGGSFTSTAFTPITESVFAAAGRGATGVQFGDGFDTTTTQNFGATPTGQQALSFTGLSSDYQFVIGFTSSTDVVLNFDWANTETSGGSFGDFLNISYSSDGVNFTSFAPNSGSSFVAPGSYAAFEDTAGWSASTDASAGFAFADGQSDASVDLSGFGEISFIRFEVDAPSASGRIGFDNIHVAGTSVPEPSAFAAILGVAALAFAANRRRRA
ncbi:MAG: PEP-CTERM sorting domain-containing protein [Verrucomicrobiota bacterium]